MAWTKKIKFTEIAEYYGLVNTLSDKGRSVITHEGKTGPKHTDNGFRLRSKIPVGVSSFKGVELKESIESQPCPLDPDDHGNYWITVKLSDGSRWDYIGEAGGETLWDRMLQHFIKMAGTTDHNGKTEDAEGYKIFRAYVKDNNINFNFETDVSVSFNKMKKSKDIKKKVHKIEGRAIERFVSLFGELPKLNTRDELMGMEGFGE
jgi:hypothetical protein